MPNKRQPALLEQCQTTEQYKFSFPGRVSHIKLKNQQRPQPDAAAKPIPWLIPPWAPLPCVSLTLVWPQSPGPGAQPAKHWHSDSVEWETSVVASIREVQQCISVHRRGKPYHEIKYAVMLPAMPGEKQKHLPMTLSGKLNWSLQQSRTQFDSMCVMAQQI